MAIFMQNFRHRRNGHDKRETQVLWKPAVNGPRKEMAPPLSINPNDPIVAYFLAAPGAVEIDKLHVQSPVLQALEASGVKMVVPMINQGQLVGLLNLGRRLSESEKALSVCITDQGNNRLIPDETVV